MRSPITAFPVALAIALAACVSDATILEPFRAETSTETGTGSPNPSSGCANIVAGGVYQGVTVAAGAACTLDNVTVNGNVVALAGARLVVRASRVNGDILGQSAALVHVTGGIVGGSIQIRDGTAPGEDGVAITGGTVLTQGNIQVARMRTARIVIADAVLQQGSLQIEENVATGSIDVLRNRVAQNLAFRRHQTNAAKTVSGNVVGDTLACSENAAPFVASGNSASSNDCS